MIDDVFKLFISMAFDSTSMNSNPRLHKASLVSLRSFKLLFALKKAFPILPGSSKLLMSSCNLCMSTLIEEYRSYANDNDVSFVFGPGSLLYIWSFFMICISVMIGVEYTCPSSRTIKISSLLTSSSIGSFSLLMPEFIYQKTNYKDQSMDPIFDLHQRNLGNFNRLNTRYFFGKDRVPDTEFLLARLKWQKRIKNNSAINFQIIKKNELKESQVINSMLDKPIGKDSQIGTHLSFENQILRAFVKANYSQKRNTLNFGQTGVDIQLPETRLTFSRNFQSNIPLLHTVSELDYAEFSIERIMPGGYKFIGGISKDLDSKKNLESYFGFGYENCCIAFKIYASDKRLSKYNLLNFTYKC